MALFGAAFLVLGLAPRLVVARHLRRQGQSVRPALRRLYLSATPWIGLIFVVGSVSHLAGGIAMLAFAVVWVTVLVVGRARGIWRLPTAVRLIGDPEAWRGNRQAYWESRADRRAP